MKSNELDHLGCAKMQTETYGSELNIIYVLVNK